jgi:hypothetical protein
MAAWEWIALGLGFLALLQLIALRYARRLGSDDERAGPRPTPPLQEDRPAGAGGPGGEGEELVCADCGAVNLADFSYCRECIAPLP